MLPATPIVLLASTLFSAPAQAQQRAAVVIGIESYQHLPSELRVVGARQDAMDVAEALETRGGFQDVRLLTDASATRAAIESLLSAGLGLGERDLFLLYFVGHGIGGDFGEPRLLTYDTDPSDLELSSWPVAELGRAIATGVDAGHAVIVTDASHAGALEGLALMGPLPDQWPELGCDSSMVISAGGPREPARPHVLAEAFTSAASGCADSSDDGVVTSGELYRHLVRTVPDATDDTLHPTVSARHDPTISVAVQAQTNAARPAAGPPRIDKVKFVFHAGLSPTVHCQPAPVVTCEPSCYVWDVQPGTCTASAILGEQRQRFEAQVLQRGRWVCEDDQGTLACHEGP
jgi:hypothetical protein